MSVPDIRERLEQFCSSRPVQRFSPSQIVELLQDGEEAGWIVGQVLPDGEESEVAELLGLLQEAQAAVKPVSPPAGAEEPAAQEASSLPESAADETAPPEVVQALAELDQLATMLPRGGDAGRLKQLLASPQGEMLADFGTFCQERGLDAQEQGKEAEARLRALHEEWLQTPRAALEGRRPAEVLEGGRLLPRKVETFRREAPKVGRNDPCPCGSGRKYKKCCGQGG
ncbi:MAG: SEC-C metal-binding domain-containing protein [Candidatus Latescibacterota bacterium]